jgi:hypothetical protein
MATEQVLIIGGGALGPKVCMPPEAPQARLGSNRGGATGGNCLFHFAAFPYYISGDVAEIKGLMTASFKWCEVVNSLKMRKMCVYELRPGRSL